MKKGQARIYPRERDRAFTGAGAALVPPWAYEASGIPYGEAVELVVVRGVILLRSRHAPQAVAEMIEAFVEALAEVEPEGQGIGSVRLQGVLGSVPPRVSALAKLRDRLGLPLRISDAQIERVRKSLASGRAGQNKPQVVPGSGGKD